MRGLRGRSGSDVPAGVGDRSPRRPHALSDQPRDLVLELYRVRASRKPARARASWRRSLGLKLALGPIRGDYVNHRAPPPPAFLGLEPRPVLAAGPPDGL